MEDFVNFTFQALKEEVGKNKTNKKILGMPAWKEITRENHKNYIKKEHKGHAILTGKMSGITIFDFDIPEVYYKFVELYPKLKTYRTIKTKNGFHVYCNYDEDIKTTTDGFVHDKGVDIRNDDAIVFAPPCQRVLLDGGIFTYEDLGGDILPVPEIFVDNMKQLEDTTDNDSIVSNEIVSSTSICAADVKYIQEAIEKGWLNDMANASYDEWRNVGFAIKHTLGDQGRQLFHQFSKINEKYDNEYTNKFWDTIKQGKKPLTLGSIKYWVRQYKEKHKKSEEDLLEAAFREMATNFELTHAKIINREIFIKEEDNIITCMTRKHLVTAYEHLVFEYNKDDIKVQGNFISKWVKNNPTMRCYTDIGIYPNNSKCPEKIYNMWRPFDMELVNDYEERPDELAVILNHIKILCGNNEVVSDYLIKWIAQMIQYPEVKTICPTLISKEGSGKGTLLLLIEKMIGSSKYFETTDPLRDVWGNFNGRMANKFLVNLNEMSKKDTLECQGKIKGLITDGKLTINNKGMNQYEIQSYHRFIITTNNEDPITTKSDDRRNLVIRTSDELKGNDEYFKKFYKMMDDVNVVKTFYEYLKNIPDMENFREIPIPQTEHQNDMKDMNMDIEERWLRDMVQNHEKDFVMSNPESLKKFMDFCIENGIDYKTNAIKLGMKIKRLLGDCIQKDRDTKSRNTIFLLDKMKTKFNMGVQVILK
jgi:hypothetical protein